MLYFLHFNIFIEIIYIYKVDMLLLFNYNFQDNQIFEENSIINKVIFIYCFISNLRN